MSVEYTELVLTAEHPLQHLDIPEMNFYARWALLFDRLCLLIRIGQTGLEIPFYTRWALLFDRLCLLIRIGQTGLIT